MTDRATRSAYGPHQMADYLGAFYGQIDRARAFGLLPEPDRSGGRWSGAVVEKIRASWAGIAAAVECVGAPRLKERGWTEAMIRDLLGSPDWTADNPYYKSAAPMRLWRLQRAEAAESSPGFTAIRQRAADRGAAAAKASETRKIWKALGGS